MKKFSTTLILPFFLFALFFTSCDEEKVESPSNQENHALYDLLQEWYLWYDQLPEVDPAEYNNPGELLEDVRYENDYWSYITTIEEFESYYQEGAFIGYGFGFSTDTAGNQRILYTYENSPLASEGVERGWIIERVDGEQITSREQLSELLGPSEAGLSNEFLLISPEGDSVEQTFTKQEMTINTVIHSSVIEHGGHLTGYMVLNGFIEKTTGEVYQVFQDFAQQNIDQLVIDLRYNGGGMLNKANEIADYIIGDEHIGDIFIQILHNDKKTDQNSYSYFQQDSLELNTNFPALYFITSGASASASEALINGMKPYKDVYLIGDQTYGKPVGMYAFYDNQGYYAYVPVCFRVANANEESDYFQGIPVDVEAMDDMAVPFGSPEEDRLQQALHHIETGTFLIQKQRFHTPDPVFESSYRRELVKTIKE